MATYSGNANSTNSPEPTWRAESILPTTRTSLRPLPPKTGVKYPKCWVGLAISSCWDYHSCDGDSCLQSAGWGSDPPCKAINVTSASHQHRGVGRRLASLSVCSAIQFSQPTLSKPAFLMLKGCTGSSESAFPHGKPHATRDLSLSTPLMIPSTSVLLHCNWPSSRPDRKLTKENLFWVSPQIKWSLMTSSTGCIAYKQSETD